MKESIVLAEFTLTGYTAVDRYTQVCVVIDDASRMILAGGEFYSQTAENSIRLLKEAYKKYEHICPIREVITDHGIQFYGVRRDCNGESDHSFENFCKEYGIKQIYARVKHPQTNGKVERWFQTYEKDRHRFSSFENFVDWYNKIRPHRSLDMSSWKRRKWHSIVKRKAVDIIRGNCIRMMSRVMGIFESVSRGEDTPDSDVNTLYLFEENRGGMRDLGGLKYYLEELFGRKTDLISINYVSPLIRKNVIADAILRGEQAVIA